MRARRSTGTHRGRPARSTGFRTGRGLGTATGHQGFGAGLARLELKLWIEETLRRFPDLALDGACERVSSTFLNQYREMPVALHG